MSLADAWADFEIAAGTGTIGLANFGDLRLTATDLIHGDERYPLRGLKIAVDTAGNITSRPTLTRYLFTGPLAFAWQKKIDAREMYLTIEGPTFGFVIPVHPDDAYGARQFAAQVNAASRALDY